MQAVSFPAPEECASYRVIYYARIEQGLIFMLTIYPKNVKDDIQAEVFNAIRKEVENV